MTDPDFQQYARSGCPEAFRRVVAGHLGMVLSTARRVLGNGSSGGGQAEDVAQAVFVLLARKAGRLPSGILVGAWLHRQAVRLALNAQRGEFRRVRREREFGGQLRLEQEEAAAAGAADDGTAEWREAGRFLDQALLRLRERDREAVMLRYWHHLPLAEVGTATGLSPAAAQKRVSRALEKLKGILTRRGVGIPAVGGITVLLGENAGASVLAGTALPARAVEAFAQQALAMTTATAAASITSAASASSAKAAGASGLTAGQEAAGWSLGSGWRGFFPVKAAVCASVIGLGAGGGWWAAGNSPTASLETSAALRKAPETAGLSGNSRENADPWLRGIGQARGAEDLAALAAEALRTPNPAERQRRLEQVFARWVEVDADAGWAWARKSFPEKMGSMGEASPDGRLSFLSLWLAVDGPAAYAAYRKALPPGDGPWEERLAQEWARRDCRGLLAFVDSGHWSENGEMAREAALRELAGTEPMLAFEKCLKMGDRTRLSVISAAAETLAARDPAAALVWARGLSADGEERDSAVHMILGTLAKTRPAQAAEWLDLELPGKLTPDIRERCAWSLLPLWMEQDPAAAADWALSHDYGIILAESVSPGSKDAERIRAALPDDGQRATWDMRMSENWTPSAAGEWLEAHPVPATDAEQATASAGLQAWLREEPEKARDWVERLPEGPEREKLRDRLLSGLAENGTSPELLMEQLGKLRQVPANEKTRRAMSFFLDESRQSELLEKIQSFPPSADRDDWLATTAAVWADRDPAEAVAWVEALPSPATRAVAVDKVLETWWPSDPEAAERWAAGQPEGKLRDTASACMARNLAAESPDQSLAWAMKIGDEAMRLELAGKAVSAWAVFDPAAAAAALEAADLSEGGRRKLREIWEKSSRPLSYAH